MLIHQDVLVFLPFSVVYRLMIPDRSLPPLYTAKYEWILRCVPCVVRDMVGMEHLLDASFLPWNDDYIGHTGYIDRIKYVPSSVMVGEDPHHRAFITIRTRRRDEEALHYDVTTLFQRYSDDRSTWTYGAHHPSCWMSGFMYFCQKDILRQEACRALLRSIMEGIHPVHVLV